jgi:hypothetical protein
MLEKSIEANIIAAIEALNLTGLDIHGAWQAANAGEVKDEEAPAAPATLTVHVGPRSFETFGIGVCSMDVVFALVIRTDLNPMGTALETYVDPIADLLQSWNNTKNCNNPCGMAVEGEFVPGGLQMVGGSGPVFEREAAIWSVTFNFTLRGSIVESAPTETPSQTP